VPSPHFEVPAGAIDGANVVFTTSVAYQAGSTVIFVNGLLRQRTLDDGWIETDSIHGIVTLKIPPIGGDTIQIFFTDTLASPDAVELTALAGAIEDADEVSASFLDASVLLGQVT
jgi:hypothetical protein